MNDDLPRGGATSSATRSPQAGVEVTPPKGTIYIWAPVPDGFESAAAYCEHVLEQAAVVISPGDAYGPSGEGFFRISLTTPDERLLEAVERLAQPVAPPGYHQTQCSEAATDASTRPIQRSENGRRRAAPVSART